MANLYDLENFRNMLIIKDNKLLVDWREKSGCTTIVNVFFDYLNILEESKKLYKWVHKYRVHHYYKKFGYVDSIKISHGEYKDYRRIKFVRNPYSRAVSSYLHLMNNKKNYIRHNQNYNIGDWSFYEFLKFVEKNKYSGSHWSPQIRNIEIKIENFYDDIIKIEDFSKKVNYVNNKYNLKLKYNKESGHHRKKNVNNTNFVGHSNYSILKKNIPKYIFFYNSRIRKLVEEIYKDDLKYYNYTFTDFWSSL